MRILIRIEPNGSTYIDKFPKSNIDYSQPPYNFIEKDIDEKFADCICTDFDGLEFSIDKYNARKCREKIEELRQQREQECFAIINRGKLWYDNLTEEQIIELNEWYRKWLDLPSKVGKEDYQIPEVPKWLK